MFEGRENDESILNSDTGISSDSALSFTLVSSFFIFMEKILLVEFFFLMLQLQKCIFLKIVNVI